MKRICILAFILLSLPLMAQEKTEEPMVTLSAGVKTFYPSRMGIPGSASLLEALQAAPEMLVSGKSSLVDDYSLTVDGNGYLQDEYLFLIQTKVREVECIQLCQDSSASSTEPQVNGVINVVMKKKATGFHGYSDLVVNTKGDFSPDVYFSYGGSKWSAWLSATGSRRQTKEDTWSVYEDERMPVDKVKTTNSEKTLDKSETVKLGVSYSDAKDKMTFDFSQQYAPEFNLTTSQIEDYPLSKDEKNEKTQSYVANLNYSHKFGEKLTFTSSLGSSFSKDPVSETNGEDNMTKNSWSSAVSGSVEFNWSPIKMLSFGTGTNAILSQMFDDYDMMNSTALMSYTTLADIVTLKPFLKFSLKPSDKWLFQANVRMMYNNIYVGNSIIAMDKWQRDYVNFMGGGQMSWSPDKHNGVMFGFNQILSTPDYQQLYPQYFPNGVSLDVVYRGNEELDVARYNVFNLSYSYNGNHVSVNVGTKYYHCGNFIQEKFLQTLYIGGLGGTPIRATKRFTWDNYGHGDAISATIGAAIHFGWFSMSSGVLYSHSLGDSKDTGVKDYSHDIWSARICPVAHLWYDFTLSSTVMLTGREWTMHSKTEPNWWASLCLSKKLGSFDVFVMWENLANHEVMFYKWDDDSNTYGGINRHSNKVSIGASYSF